MTALPPGALTLAEELTRYALDLLGTGRGPFPDADIDTKAHPADPVTAVDRAVEAHVRRRITEVFPDHRVHGEESDPTGPAGARHVWWVDPVDGTTNFAHGIGWYSFSLALTVDGAPVLGIVADPARGEVHQAAAGSPATVNGRPTQVSPSTGLSGTVLLTEWLAHAPWEGMDRLLTGLADTHCTARIMGSSALSLVQVASGRAAAAVIGQYSAIDDLAGAYIAARAGAHVLSADGTLTPSHGGIAVTAPGVSDHLRDLLPPWARHPSTTDCRTLNRARSRAAVRPAGVSAMSASRVARIRWS